MPMRSAYTASARSRKSAAENGTITVWLPSQSVPVHPSHVGGEPERSVPGLHPRLHDGAPRTQHPTTLQAQLELVDALARRPHREPSGPDQSRQRDPASTRPTDLDADAADRLARPAEGG